MKAKKHLEEISRFDNPYLGRLDKTRLDRNERISAWPATIWKEMQKFISPEVIMSYPELDPVYEKLAAVLGIKRNSLLLSHGSDSGLKSVFEVFIAPGDEAVVLTPSYAMYPVYAKMAGAEAVEVGFQEDLSLPFERVLDAITSRTRIVCLPNPNQPIERVFTKEELKKIFELSTKKDFIVVIDEAYHYFYPESVIADIKEYPNLIVTRSFSKAFGLAGLRAGLLISNPEKIQSLRSVKPISEINSVAVRLIEFFLERMDLVEAYVEEVNKGRRVILERAAQLNMPTHGRTGNSILLQLQDADQVKMLVAKALEKGYLIKGPFPYPAVKHLRITLGPENIMIEIMDIIERSLGWHKILKPGILKKQ